MRTISFYQTATGNKPIQEYLDSLTDKQVEKIAWVLKLIRELDRIPSNYFKKLINADDIWEVRTNIGGNSFRFLGFFHGQELIILTNAFQKKTQKTPLQEIKLAEKRRNEYLNRRKTNG